MTPLIAAGAASVAGELVSRVAGAVSSSLKSSPSAASLVSHGRGFDTALHRAAGGSLESSQLEILQQQVWQIPEVAAALSSQPAGTVTAAEVRADGSVALLTSRGPVEVAVSAESRNFSHRIYQGMVASGAGRAELFAAATGVLGAGGAGYPSGQVSGLPGVVIPARGTNGMK